MAFEWQYIASKSNPLVVRLGKLKDKKYRKEEALFRFDGIKLFEEARQNGVKLEYVIISESQSGKIKPIVEDGLKNCDAVPKLLALSDDAFSKLTEEKSPEGIICVSKHLDNLHKVGKIKIMPNTRKERILLLESVRDAGNLGTIIRCARAFAIDRLVISSDCADLYNSKTIRAAMGALFTQNINIVESIPEAVGELRVMGYRIFAAALDKGARELGSFELEEGDAILVGNEGHGLTSEAKSACDESVFIPMEQSSESLNAAIAASVCMWELYKAKKEKGGN